MSRVPRGFVVSALADAVHTKGGKIFDLPAHYLDAIAAAKGLRDAQVSAWRENSARNRAERARQEAR